MPDQIRAILWAQFKVMLHFRGGAVGAAFSGLIALAWYSLWAGLAVLLGMLAANPERLPLVEASLTGFLALAIVYWQLSPMFMASLGASLDLRKLAPYPVTPGKLFAVEVCLRLSTCIEILVVVAGVAVGLFLNPALPSGAAPAALILFALFNLLLASGLRYQIERWMARPFLRDAIIFLLVMAAALPQLLVATGVPTTLRQAITVLWGPWWPWSAAARLALGHAPVAAWAAILAWTAAAWSYGRWQFGRSMRLEEAGVVSVARLPARRGSRREWLYRLPSKFLPDPLAAVVEKELRSLARSPRFRLLFLMGFSFSFLVFLPFLRRGASPMGRPEPYYLSGICCYALLLLGDVAFWNIFGQDRAAAQLYFLQPLQLRTVVAGKNIAAGIAVLLEVTGVVAVWAALRLPVSPGRVMEAYLAPAILCISFMAMGNLASVYFPRAVRADKSTGAGSSGRFRVMLLPLLPVVSLPVLLAYGARYAFHGQFAFYALLGFAALVNSVFYWFALQTAVAKAEERKERLLEALSQSEAPLQLT